MKRRSLATLGIAAGLAFLASHASATTPNSPDVLDGVANVDATDWDADELFLEDPVGDSAWGPFNDLQGFWVTWDDQGIYLAVQGALWDQPGGQVGANSVNLYLDVDYGQGTGISDMSEIDQNALDAVTRNLWRPLAIGSGFGADFGFTNWAGQFDLGFLDLADPAAPVNRVAEITLGRDLADHRGYELFLPWSVLFPTAANQVPPGTRMAVVVAQVGGGDSLSPESLPDGADDRLIEAPISFTVDADGDGFADRDWPPSGSISGTVTLSDPEDLTTVIDVVARLGGTEVGRASTPPGGGAYSLDRLPPGTYDVAIDSDFYISDPQSGVSVGENEAVTGIDFAAQKVNGGISFGLAFADGPEATVRTLDVVVEVRRVGEEDLALPARTFTPADPLQVDLRPLLDGAYEIQVTTQDPTAVVPTRTGYVPLEISTAVVDDSITALGPHSLAIARATRIAFFPAADPISQTSTLAALTTVSVPSFDFYSYLGLDAALVDSDGIEALHDEDAKGGITLTATSMVPSIPTEGTVTFWDPADTTAVAQPLDGAFGPGEARVRFLVTDDAQEVVLLRAQGNGLSPGVLEIGVLPVEPDRIALDAEAGEMVAGEAIGLSGNLLDVSGNPVALPDQEIHFRIHPDGAGTRPSTINTESDGGFGGEGRLDFVSETADDFVVRAWTEIAPGDTIFSDPIPLAVRPDVPDQLRVTGTLTLVEDPAKADVELRYDVVLTDRFGNASPRPGSVVDLAVAPAELVAQAPSTLTLDDETAAGSFTVRTAPGSFGVVEVSATLAGIPNPTTTTRQEILFGLAATDEAAPETDEDHNADPGLDLTAMFVVVDDGDLVVTLPFAATFGGTHLVLLIETGNDAEGAVEDYFGFPVAFAHDVLPDFVFTYKYSADDYADFRRPPQGGNPQQWEWYNIATGIWVGDFADGVNARAEEWVTRTETDVTFRVPLDVVAPGFQIGMDTLRLQVYAPQEDGDKRPALDSIPHDDTVDMIPPSGEWWQNLPPQVTLDEWAEVSPGNVPSFLSLTSTEWVPQEITQGESALLTARPDIDTGDPAAPASPRLQVFANLTRFGGDAFTAMVDDGTGGDATAGDGIYSLEWTAPLSTLPGDYRAVVQVTELVTGTRTTGDATLAVTGDPELEPIIAAEDPEGDDHGPNQEGVEFLYYQYPTSGVFFDGVFDLTGLEVFDAGERLLLRVSLADLTNPSEDGAADWNAIYPEEETCPPGSRVDLNLQNIVVLIDSEDGGATNLPQNRYADVAVQDAWDFAVVADGWWRGLVESNGSDIQGDWTLYKTGQDYFYCANSTENTVDMFVSKERLGLDGASVQEVVDRVSSWDFIVMISGHDGDSDDNNWGGVRWVNEGRAPEWQFGGGRQGEANRERDPNLLDILAVTGAGKTPGRSQEEMLDFLTPEAQRRFETGILDAVTLEAEELIDTAPPRITLPLAKDRAFPRSEAMQDGPVVIEPFIDDQTGVASATMKWRGLGEPRSAAREVPVGLLRCDLDNDGRSFIADIDPALVYDPAVTQVVDSVRPDGDTEEARYIVVSFEAEDVLGNRTNPATAREYLVQLPVAPLVGQVASFDLQDLPSEDTTLQVPLNEGSRIRMQSAALREVLGSDVTASIEISYAGVGTGQLDLTRHGGNESILGSGNRYLGTARRVTLSLRSGTSLTPIPRGAIPYELSIHYPGYAAEGVRPADVQIFEWVPRSERWIAVGGHGEPCGNTMTVNLDRSGLFAVFTKDSELDGDNLVTGLQLSPNPFSPNGDGLYDEVNISYVLNDQISQAVVEIFDLRGSRVRTLKFFGSEDASNRNLGLTWDGRDEEGNQVPMGIYICRVEVLGANINRWERATEAVAVVR